MMMNDVENLSLWHIFEDFNFGWDCLAKISWQTRGMMTPYFMTQGHVQKYPFIIARPCVD
jgi:hypothetical protein